LVFQSEDFNKYLRTAEGRDPKVAGRISVEISRKFFGLFGDSDVNRLVDTSSLLDYLSSLLDDRNLAPSTVCDKLRNIELAIDYIECKYDDEINDLEHKCKKAIKWLKQRSKISKKKIGGQRVENSIRGEENVSLAENPAFFYESFIIKEKVQAIFKEATSQLVPSSDFKLVLAYISSILIYTNAQRPGAIENMTLTEYEARTELEPDKYLVRVKKHKTASKGPANVVFNKHTEECMEKYKTLLRSQVTPQSREISNLFFMTATGKRCDKLTENIK